MKIITEITESNSLLESYGGATLQIVMYTFSLKRLALRLLLPKENQVLYVIGLGCESLSGLFSFTNANLNISIDRNNEEPLTIIADKFGKFLLITSGGFSLALGFETEFGTTFDNFFLDK